MSVKICVPENIILQKKNWLLLSLAVNLCSVCQREEGMLLWFTRCRACQMFVRSDFYTWNKSKMPAPPPLMLTCSQ